MPAVSTLLYLLSVICCLLVLQAYYVNGNPAAPGTASTDIKIFTVEEMQKVLEPEVTKVSGGKITFNTFFSPHLVATNNVVVAVAGANCNDDSKENIHILTRHIEISKMDKWVNSDTKNNIESSWTTQYTAKKAWEKKEKKSSFFLAAAKDDKIYILAVNIRDQKPPGPAGSELQWDCKLFVGSVTDKTPPKEKTSWDDVTSLNSKIDELKKKQDQLGTIQSDGYVLSTDKENVFFVLKFEKKGTDNKNSAAFIKLDTTTATVMSADVYYTGDCSFNLFTWKKKL